MEWIKRGSSYAGKRSVEIKTVRIPDEKGTVRRFRTTTVRDAAFSFTKVPASGRLFKSEKGYIGVLVEGKNMGYVKIGKKLAVRADFVVPLDSVSKKSLAKLLKGIQVETVEIDGSVLGIER